MQNCRKEPNFNGLEGKHHGTGDLIANTSPALFCRGIVSKQLELFGIQFHQKFLFLSCIRQLVCMFNNCKKPYNYEDDKQTSRPEGK